MTEEEGRMGRKVATCRTRTQPSRREFLGCTALGAAALATPTIATRGLLGKDAPSEKITVGCIGMGGHGVNRNLRMLLRQSDARVISVCDVFDGRRDAARAGVDKAYDSRGCSSHTDFRKIIDQPDVDALMISTPDHWHVLMSVLGMRAGKDVICEKPTLTIREGQILTSIVKKRKAVFQTSTEDRSLPCYHHMAGVVRNGLIGKVRRVEVELPAGQNFPNEQAVKVPAGLDWDLWLGPAPLAPYTKSRTERQHWRHVWDYSGGKFSDWGMHQLDTVQWALDKERTGPVEVEGSGTVNPGSMYNTFVTYEVRWRYADGVEVHVKSGGTSLRFIGEKGWIGNPRFAARCTASDAKLVEWKPEAGDVHLYTNPAGEHRDFLDCVKTRKEPYFPAEIGHRCASLVHMGNIAMRLGRKLRWDPAKEEFVGDADANAMCSRVMRKPWTLQA